MARPIKQGLEYFPLDINFLRDIKVRKIMKACGANSVSILISLLSSIYRDEGYYVAWDSDIPFLIADEVGVSEGAVIEVVNKAVQVKLFDETIFNQYKILTSKGVQERYIQAVERRKQVELIEEYLLISTAKIVNVNINEINVDINPENDYISTQSKVKESKVNKIKEREDALAQEIKNTYGEFQNVRLSPKEFSALVEKFGAKKANDCITNLDDYIATHKKGEEYTSHYATIVKWERQDRERGSGITSKNSITPNNKKSKFVNYEQRTDWDFAELERLENEKLDRECQEREGQYA